MKHQNADQTQPIAKEKAPVSESFLRAALDDMPSGLGLYEYSQAGLTLLYFNDCFLDLTGYDREEYENFGARDAVFAILPEDRPLLYQTVESIAAQGVRLSCECRACTKSGETRWLRVIGAPFEKYPDRTIISAVILDITIQREAQEQLRIRDEEYQLILANSGKMICRYDVKARALDMKQDLASRFGLPARIVGVPQSLTDLDIISKDSKPVLTGFFNAMNRGEASGDALIRLTPLNGKEHWLALTFSSIFDQEHVPVSAVISIEDVTTQREAMIVDELDRERLMVALNSTYPVSLSVNLTKGTYKVLHGMPSLGAEYEPQGRIDELISNAAKKITPEFSQTFTDRFLSAALEKRLTAGSGMERMEYLQQQSDGSYHWVETRVYLINNPYDQDVIDITLIRYIDEQKALEQKLKQALKKTSGVLSKERSYQKLLNANLPVCTVIFSKQGTQVLPRFIAGRLIEDLDFTHEEIEQAYASRLNTLILPEDYERVRETVNTAIDRCDSYEMEFRIYDKFKRVRWLYERGIRIADEEGLPTYLSLLMDITGRKEMEERLRVNDEELQLAITQMGKTICLYDVLTRTLTMPEAYARKHGLPTTLKDVPYSVAQHGLLGDEESRSGYLSFYFRIINGEKSGSSECFFKCADGSWCWERGDFVTIFSAEGKPVKAIVGVEDTTALHKLDDENEELRKSEQVLRMVAEHSNRLIYRYNPDTRTARTDKQSAQKIGLYEERAGLPDSPIEQGEVLPESIADYRRIFDEIHNGKPSGGAKVHVYNTSGKPRWMDMKYSVVFAENGDPSSAVISFIDITEEHEKELAYERYQQSIDRFTGEKRIIFFEADLTQDLLDKAGGELLPGDFPPLGSSLGNVVELLANRFIIPQEADRCRSFFSREHLMTQYSDGLRSLSEDWALSEANAPYRWMRSTLQMIQDPYTGHIRIYTLLSDITQEKTEQLAVIRQAQTDGMTGLYNRAATEAMIRQQIVHTQGEPCVMLIADLDNLKNINDTMGHAAGDDAIRKIAKSLKAQFRSTDIVGRIGGDEFLAYLQGSNDEARLRGVMSALMKKLSKISINREGTLPLRGSIGVATGITGSDTFDSLYKKADTALYHVKRNGKNDYAFYTPQMDEQHYQYSGHAPVVLDKAEVFDQAEIERLMHAISSVYPMIISANLTQNAYYMMEYEHFFTKQASASGSFDELVATGLETFHPEDRESFLAAFLRANLLNAYARGEKSVVHIGRQLGDDGVYRRIETKVVFMENNGDITQVTLAREVP